MWQAAHLTTGAQLNSSLSLPPSLPPSLCVSGQFQQVLLPEKKHAAKNTEHRYNDQQAQPSTCETVEGVANQDSLTATIRFGEKETGFGAKMHSTATSSDSKARLNILVCMPHALMSN